MILPPKVSEPNGGDAISMGTLETWYEDLNKNVRITFCFWIYMDSQVYVTVASSHYPNGYNHPHMTYDYLSIKTITKCSRVHAINKQTK